MTVIDVHTHMFTAQWLELLQKEGGIYSIKMRPDGQREIFRGDTPVVLPQKGHFDYGPAHRAHGRGRDRRLDRLADLPERVLGQRGRQLPRRARVERQRGRGAVDATRIASAGSPRCRGSTRSARSRSSSARCAKGAVGVMVLANVAGKSLTDPLFAPIWAEIDRRALPVLVHPTDPPGVDLMDMTKFDLSWSVGFMFDTTLAITRMIFEGFFDQYPEPEDDRLARRRHAALPGRPLREGRRGGTAVSAAR